MSNWTMKQTWSNLLFVHWPVSAEWLQALLPDPLKADTYEGSAWIGLVPFKMEKIRFRGLPEVPLLSSLLELNVRTYVTYNGKPGIYFFSLDASHPIGVWIARTFFHLPYFHSQMKAEFQPNEISFSSRRIHKGEPPAQLRLTYRPGPVKTQPEPLDLWLTERYCLYTVKNRKIYRGDLKHAPWSLQNGTCEILSDTMTWDFGRSEQKTLHILYSKAVETEFFPFVKLC
ncbi:YqjF family protein [Metabacillus sp. 84]|uniref:YqjF family protein n=1 Tax=Metabacillus sp. 84 TaxID=3404705 RepID=UPI003CF8EABF